MKTKKSLNNYLSEKYVSLDRWISYYHQINLVLNIHEIENKKILEVGVGNNFVNSYLKNLGLNITTYDKNKNLNSDYTGDITKSPFKDNQFDVIMSYEVLEHLPLYKVKIALRELWRVTSSYVIISLPYSGLCFSGYLKPPFYNGFIFRIPSLIYRPQFLIKKSNLTHHWALGEINSSIPKIRRLINEVGFKIIKEKIPILNSHHQFWVMKKKNNNIS